MLVMNSLRLAPLQRGSEQIGRHSITNFARCRTVHPFAAIGHARTGNHKSRSLAKPEVNITIKRSFDAGPCEFDGMFNIAATNKPSKLVFGYPFAPQFADGDGELPSIFTRVL